MTLTALILLGCGWLGWRGQATLSAAVASHEQLVAEAKELGLGLGDLSGEAPLPHSIRAVRESPTGKQEEAKAFSSRLVAFMLKIQEQMSSWDSQDDPAANEAKEKESLELMEGLLDLDAEQLKILVAQVQADSQLQKELRGGILSAALVCLAESDPPGALAFFAASPALMSGGNQGETAAAFALTRVAEKSPEQAMEWLRAHAMESADDARVELRLAMVTGVAKADPRQAFALLDELGLGTSDGASIGIASSARTPAGQTAVLGALRDHLAGVTDEQAREETRSGALSGLARTAMQEGYDKTAPWLESANLTQEEAKDYLKGISSHETREDSGKWLAWMGAKLPPDDYRDEAGEIMREWATHDFRAAGGWLNDQPDGPARQIAAGAYATAIAGYEPEAAAQWAQTLPAGEERTRVLGKVYQSWKKKDPAAAEAFARRNGLGAGGQ